MLPIRVEQWAFSIYKINPENFHWEFPFGKSAFHLSQVSFVHRPLSFASPTVWGVESRFSTRDMLEKSGEIASRDRNGDES